jgi:hypothetical protein
MLGPEVLQEVAARATVEFAPGPIRRLLPHLRDSRPLFTLAPRWWGPWVFRGSRGTCEALPDGRLREIVRILPEFDACPEFLEALQGTLRGMPRLLRQADALVTVDHDGREAEFMITPPPRRAGWRRRSRAYDDAVHDLEEFGFAREQILESARTIHRLSAKVDVQSKSLASLEKLGRCLVQERPEAFDALIDEMAELVRSELDLRGVRILRRGRGTRWQTRGLAEKSPDHRIALSVGARGVGSLEVWGPVSADARAQLDVIVPWIAFCLECGGSKSLATHLVSLLSDQVEDWDRMEQRLASLTAELSESSPATRR